MQGLSRNSNKSSVCSVQSRIQATGFTEPSSSFGCLNCNAMFLMGSKTELGMGTFQRALMAFLCSVAVAIGVLVPFDN